MIQKYKSLNINSLKTRLCFTGKSYMFMRKVVRVFEKKGAIKHEPKVDHRGI